jgi:hypothetical protein
VYGWVGVWQSEDVRMHVGALVPVPPLACVRPRASATTAHEDGAGAASRVLMRGDGEVMREGGTGNAASPRPRPGHGHSHGSGGPESEAAAARACDSCRAVGSVAASAEGFIAKMTEWARRQAEAPAVGAQDDACAGHNHGAGEPRCSSSSHDGEASGRLRSCAAHSAKPRPVETVLRGRSALAALELATAASGWGARDSPLADAPPCALVTPALTAVSPLFAASQAASQAAAGSVAAAGAGAAWAHPARPAWWAGAVSDAQPAARLALWPAVTDGVGGGAPTLVPTTPAPYLGLKLALQNVRGDGDVLVAAADVRLRLKDGQELRPYAPVSGLVPLGGDDAGRAAAAQAIAREPPSSDPAVAAWLAWTGSAPGQGVVVAVNGDATQGVASEAGDTTIVPPATAAAVVLPPLAHAVLRLAFRVDVPPPALPPQQPAIAAAGAVAAPALLPALPLLHVAGAAGGGVSFEPEALEMCDRLVVPVRGVAHPHAVTHELELVFGDEEAMWRGYRAVNAHVVVRVDEDGRA